ncbi:hypothetical protein DFJ74DRAFT_772667 [Hyaloraphidium curvatum]|nr:hypothetical protein DFJ74DRAFT_772667 [Hyaloraphidium curvatum]
MPPRKKKVPAPLSSYDIVSSQTTNGRQKFPVEVLRMIFSYAPDAALFNALMTCRLWFIMAAPVLWRDGPCFRRLDQMYSFLFSNYTAEAYAAGKRKPADGSRRKPLRLKDRDEKEFKLPYLSFVRRLLPDRTQHPRDANNDEKARLYGRCTGLEHVHFGEFHFNSECLDQLAKKANAKLKHLHLEWLIKDQRNVVSFLESFPKLESLEIVNSAFFDDTVLIALSYSHGTKMKRLVLNRTCVSAFGLRVALPRFAALGELDLSYKVIRYGEQSVPISDRVLDTVAEHGKHLRVLRIREHPAGTMTEGGVLKLIASMPNLELLDATGNASLSGGERIAEGGAWDAARLELMGKPPKPAPVVSE